MGGLTGALQTAHEDDRRRAVRPHQPGRLSAHELRQLLVDDLNDHLGGGQALHDLGSHRRLDHLIGEIPGDLIVDVRLQQRQTHLPHGVLDVRLAELAFIPQLFE